jgi:hypothetical protein
LYDIARILNTPYCESALQDDELFNTILRHRERLTRLPWVDYSSLSKKTLRFVPHADVIADWRKDYASMQENMIHGESDVFDKMISKLNELNARFNAS